MSDDFMELLKKKAKEQGGPRKDEEMDAKASIMENLSKMLGKDLHDGIQQSKKVVVSSDSEEGLKEGLEKAEDIVEDKMSDSEEKDEEESEDKSEEESEDKDELKKKIAMLESQLEELKSKA